MTSVDRILLLVLHALLLQRIASQTPPSSNSSGEDFNFQITVAMNNDTKQEAQEDQQVAQKSTDIPMQLLDDTESYGRYADELVNCTDFLPIEQIASGYDNCSQVIDSLATFQNLGLNFSLCDSEVVWRQGYCQKTCGLCLDCEDTPYPEINLECNSVKAVGLCREMEIYQDATYCGRSCNTCEVLAKRQGGFGCSNAKTIQCDVDALLLFKSMMSENAQKELSSWVGDDPCSWQGVSCNYGNQRVTKLQLGEYVRINKTERTQDDSRTVKSNAVQKFEKRNNNAFGGQMYAQLPPQISQMMYLEVLQLSGNEISGTLPPELSMLTNLQHLVLFDNKFNGTIPPELSTLTSLNQEMHLGSNDFSGEIPAEFSTLSNLWGMYLFDNFLSGSVPMEVSSFGSTMKVFNIEPQYDDSLCILSEVSAYLQQQQDLQTDVGQVALCN